jgi:long-chain acyl-CoA synthetase
MKSSLSDSLIERWEQLSRLKTEPAILDTKGKVLRTFAQIEEEAAELGRTFLSRFRAGEVIAIQIGNHPAWPALLLANLRRRLVTLPIERSMAIGELEAALQTCGAAAIVETSQTQTKGEQIGFRWLAHKLIDWGAYQPSLLKLTSGTTAAPRAIRFRSEQLLADCEQICATMGITKRDLNFAAIPLSHSYGFSNLVTPLITRGVPMVLSSDTLPRALLDDLAQTRATVFPGMPVFYQALSEIDNVSALPILRLCISAGAPLPLEVAKKFRAKFNQPIHSFYGSSECGGICFDKDAHLLEPGFVGQPMEGVDLEPFDQEACATRIRIHSPAAGDGYFPEADDDRLGKGKFIPDDLINFSRDGVRIVGRISDIINVAGKKVNPAEVEAELLRISGVRAAVVFGRASQLRNEEVAACIVAEPGVRESDVLEHCRASLSGWQVPKRVFFVEEIPINDRGKINRREVASRFHS